MIWSVISRRARPGGTPSYRPRTSIGSPNAHGHLDQARPPRADGLEPASVPDAARPGRSGRPRSARAARRRCARGRAGRRASGCPRGRCRRRRLRRARRARCRGWPAPPWSRRGRPAGHRAPRTTPCASRPLSPGLLEVVGLGQEADRPRHHDRDHHAVDEAQVVAGQDHRTGRRHPVETRDRRPPHGLGQRRDDGVQEPVEHALILPHPLPRPALGLSGARRTACWS